MSRRKKWQAYCLSFLAKQKKLLAYLLIALLSFWLLSETLIFFLRGWKLIENLWQALANEEVKLKFFIEITKAIVLSVVGIAIAIAVGVAIYFNIKIAHKNSLLLEKKQENEYSYYQNQLIIERFSKSVEQLSSSKPQVRLGGIYSLEQVAIESPKDHWTIVEIITSLIQESFPFELENYDSSNNHKNDLPEISIDIQAALTVIGRRIVQQDPVGKYLNLSFTYLVGADLGRANLSGADLSRAGLIGADLSEADLKGAGLSGAYLIGADLSKADLSGADLIGANLWKAILVRANLTQTGAIGADFSGADLSGANLSSAYLSGANFSGAELSRANLSRADLWKADLIKTNLKEADLREADFWKANLSEANLNGAKLSGADFSRAKNLTSEQVKLAKDWENAKYDEELCKQLYDSE